MSAVRVSVVSMNAILPRFGRKRGELARKFHR